MSVFNILFVCTGNSCRSQMAEGFMNHLAAAVPPFLEVRASSAGLEPQGVNPLAIQVMAARGVDISHQASRLLTDAMIEAADLIVTVCSSADARCPLIPEGRRKIHLPFDDPAAATGSREQVVACFNAVRDAIEAAVAELLQKILVQYLDSVRGRVFNSEDVAVQSRRPLYQGFIPVDELVLQHRLYTGGWSDHLRRELAVRPPAVGVLLFDPDRDEVVLVKQFRTGVLDRQESPWLLEIVAGLADAGEAMIEVARREAREEANCDVTNIIPICDYYNSPGWSNEHVSLFCAQVNASALEGIHGLDEEHEDILLVTLPREMAENLIGSGEINNAMTIIALQWLQAHQATLKQKWSQLAEPV